jgi:GTP cyclohydrolase I
MPKLQANLIQFKEKEMERLIARQLLLLGLEGPNYEDTPARVAKMWGDNLRIELPKMTSFPLRGKPSMILIKDHLAYGQCPHHLLPVKYTFRIGYIPNKRVLGLSKLARIADYYASKLYLQEEIPYLICEAIEEAIDPKGSACLIQGEHLCMHMRGVESEGSSAVSSYLSGIFLLLDSTASEFRSL